jgi:hypothetical protein
MTTHAKLKMTKASADYEPRATGPDECCHCRFFIRGPGQCTKVEGHINAGGWCRMFKR